MVVLRGNVVGGWSLKFEWVAACVCGCARALLIWRQACAGRD